MSECCGSPTYERMFTARMARWSARRYSWKGLGRGPRQTLQLYESGVISGNTLLEVGGGIGDLQLELLKAGVDRVISVEISPSYEETASRLIEEAGVENRVTRILGDFVDISNQLDRSDLVVMHLVICCYPDAEALMKAATDKTNRYLVMTYPPDSWWLRRIAAIQDLWYRYVRKSDFRYYIHPPDLIHKAATTRGLRLCHQDEKLGDRLAVFERASPKRDVISDASG